MAKDPGGLFDFSPCFWFCCLRKRPRRDSTSSNKSRSFDYSESEDEAEEHVAIVSSSREEANEGDRIIPIEDRITPTGYGATEDAVLVKEEILSVDGEIAVAQEEIAAETPVVVESPEPEPEPSWSEIAEDYSIGTPSITSPELPEFSSEEEGEDAISKPIEGLLGSTLAINQDGKNSDVSPSSSIEEVRVIGDTTSYKSLTNVYATQEQLANKVGDTSSVGSWNGSSLSLKEEIVANQADRISLRSQGGDTASVKSWVSRTSKTSAKSLQAETASVKSLSKEETDNLDQQVLDTPSLLEISAASLSDVVESPAPVEVNEIVTQETSVVDEAEVVVKTSIEAELPAEKTETVSVDVQPVPSIEIVSSPTSLETKESMKSKNSDDSGVVLDASSSISSQLKSHSAVLSDGAADAISLKSATSVTSLDSAGLPKKKKKKKFFKKLHFKKKKKNKLTVQDVQYSASTPNLAVDHDASSSFMSQSSEQSRYSASLLLSALDDLSDDDICKD